MADPSAPIRFGIIGCADIARKLSRAINLSPNASLAAVGSRSSQKAAQFAAANSFPASAKVYGSYDAVLDDPEIDAVYLPLPTSLHVAWAVKAAEKKKHVLLEKPVAINAFEFDTIIEACERNGVQFMDGTMWMHHPRTSKINEFLSDSESFGELKAAAEKKKHVLLEKPVAINAFEFDTIIEACERNGVQFMDGTMWMHHPRTSKVKEFLSDSESFGELKAISSNFGFSVTPDFLENDIRTKPDLDGLGALGDVGWYCIRSILWAADFELPKFVTALPGTVFNKAGVILTCGASLHWEDGKVATFHCSFLQNLTMDVTFVGTKGTLHMHDFVIPYEEKKASFSTGIKSGFNDLMTGWVPKPSEHTIMTDLPQECLMVREFSRLVADIKNNGAKPEIKWPTFSRKTQLTLDAVKESVYNGSKKVEIVD